MQFSDSPACYNMGKIRIVRTGENCGYLYIVCKKNPSITAIQEEQILSMTATEKGGKIKDTRVAFPESFSVTFKNG